MIREELVFPPASGAAQRFLVLACRAQRSREQGNELQGVLTALGSEPALRLAQLNHVEAAVADVLTSTMGDRCPDGWLELAAWNEARVDALVAAAEEVCGALDAAGCAPAAIEAGGVMLGSDLPKRAYGSGDIDLLVRRDRWQCALDVMEQCGFRERDRRGRPTKRREMYKLAGEQELWIEIGCEPFDRMWVPLHVVDRCDGWIEQRVAATKSHRVRVLAPAHALAVAAFHTSLHSFIRAPGLRLHLDVDRIARLRDLDWSEAVREITAMEVTTRAFVALSMAAGLLDAPVPMEVLSELCPSRARWRAIRSLLVSQGWMHTGEPKLGRLQTLLLDALIDQRSPVRWAASALLPEREWMREHFDRKATGASLWRLHGRRISTAVSGWRPR